jgi:hypothetical protein
VDSAWRFLVIPRVELTAIRDRYELTERRSQTGRAPVSDADAKTDEMAFRIEIDGPSAEGWGASLTPYLDQWPEALPILDGGPGAREAGGGVG